MEIKIALGVVSFLLAVNIAFDVMFFYRVIKGHIKIVTNQDKWPG